MSLLSLERSSYNVREEHRFRRFQELFKSHLGPYSRPEESPNGSQNESDQYKLQQSINQSSQVTGQKRKLTEDAFQGSSKNVRHSVFTRRTKPNHDADIALAGEGGLEHQSPAPEEIRQGESRRRLDEIFAPHLDDNGTVYDIPEPRKGITSPRLMSGALRGRQVRRSTSTSSRPASGDSIGYDHENESDAVHEPNLILSRKQRSSTKASRATGHIEEGKPTSLGDRREGRGQQYTEVRSFRIQQHDPATPDSGSSAQDQESPSQRTLKALQQSSARKPVPLPKDWGSASCGRKDSTKISGPYPPRMKTRLIDGPPQSFECLHPGPCLESAETPFTDSRANRKGTMQKARSSLFSEWAGRSITPIPLPSIPNNSTVWNSQAQTETSVSSPTSPHLHTPQPTIRQEGTQSARCMKQPDALVPASLASQEASGSLLRRLPGTAKDDCVALDDEKRRWRSMLGL